MSRSRGRFLLLSLASLTLPIVACGVAADRDTGDDSASAVTEGTADARTILAVANDAALDAARFKSDVGLTTTASNNLVTHRNGADGQLGTDDDDRFDTVRELDDVAYIGAASIARILAYGKAHGYENTVDVVFSPQPSSTSHLARIAPLIANAKTSIDLAMYSFSDATLQKALKDAAARGVKVRYMSETAGDDKSLSGDAKAKTANGQLEAAGVDVRYVNKVMHHKFVVIDGPRDDLSLAASAKVVTGSANWSQSGAGVYDENTLFSTGHAELALRLQREFNTMWEHAGDFTLDPPATPIPFVASTAVIDDDAIAKVDEPGFDAHFTSSNFSVKGTTFSSRGTNEVADAIVASIVAAKKSIHIASDHMRSRPVADALIEKHKSSPEVEIRVYLDQQEYISSYSDSVQKQTLAACLAKATTDAQQRACTDKGYLYGASLGAAGIDVRYKVYSYRWDATYAAQLHDKYFLFDGQTVMTGSYNLSDNAEHDTFENMLTFTGDPFATLAQAYEGNFGTIWETARGAGFDALEQRIATADPVPLVFPPVALLYSEVGPLKDLLRANCPAADSTEYRENAPAHQSCPRSP